MAISTKHIWRHAGPKLKISDPETLWRLACDYFEWVEENPIFEAQLVSYQGVSNLEPVPKARAMTWEGFATFCGMSTPNLLNYAHKEEFEEVMAVIKACIRDQKFTLAAAGLLNANLIGRDLGIGEVIDHRSSDGSMTPSRVDAALVERLAKMLVGDE